MKRKVNIKKRKKYKLIKLIFIMIFFMLTICFGGIYLVNKSSNNMKNIDHKKETKNTILGKYVLVIKEQPLYKLKDGKFVKSGTVGKDVTLELESYDKKYYKVKNLENDYYVRSDFLVNTEDLLMYDDRYKKYIVYNLNVETEEKTIFYDAVGNLVYSFNRGISLPIIIKDKDKYGVEFDDRILYIKREGTTVVEKKNTDLENINGIGVLNYHFFYDNDIIGESQKCNQAICASKKQFKTHLDYIKENNFFTPTMEELEMYIDGKIQLPKSVVITIDDGWRVDLAIKMLNEYKLNGTIFVVTSWYDPNKFRTDYVEVHSHSDNMHNTGECSTGQGGGIQCLDEEFILNDLKTSSKKIGGTTVFCYPFYEFNDYSISMLKKAGYTMAFAGESSYSDNLVKVGSNKYRLPRFVVVNYTTMDNFINYLN